MHKFRLKSLKQCLQFLNKDNCRVDLFGCSEYYRNKNLLSKNYEGGMQACFCACTCGHEKNADPLWHNNVCAFVEYLNRLKCPLTRTFMLEPVCFKSVQGKELNTTIKNHMSNFTVGNKENKNEHNNINKPNSIKVQKYCDHVFEKKAIEFYFGEDHKVECPALNCNFILSKKDLIFDVERLEEIKRFLRALDNPLPLTSNFQNNSSAIILSRNSHIAPLLDDTIPKKTKYINVHIEYIGANTSVDKKIPIFVKFNPQQQIIDYMLYFYKHNESHLADMFGLTKSKAEEINKIKDHFFAYCNGKKIDNLDKTIEEIGFYDQQIIFLHFKTDEKLTNICNRIPRLTWREVEQQQVIEVYKQVIKERDEKNQKLELKVKNLKDDCSKMEKTIKSLKKEIKLKERMTYLFESKYGFDMLFDFKAKVVINKAKVVINKDTSNWGEARQEFELKIKKLNDLIYSLTQKLQSTKIRGITKFNK